MRERKKTIPWKIWIQTIRPPTKATLDRAVCKRSWTTWLPAQWIPTARPIPLQRVWKCGQMKKQSLQWRFQKACRGSFKLSFLRARWWKWSLIYEKGQNCSPSAVFPGPMLCPFSHFTFISWTQIIVDQKDIKSSELLRGVSGNRNRMHSELGRATWMSVLHWENHFPSLGLCSYDFQATPRLYAEL